MLNKSLPSQPISSGGHMNRSASESLPPPPVVTPTKTGAFSHFLRRKRQDSVDSPPPPTPPKDAMVPQFHHRQDSTEQAYTAYTDYAAHHSPKHSYEYNRSTDYNHGINRPRRNSLSDVVHITHDDSDMVVIEPQRPPTALESKWAAEPSIITDPAERARRRSEARRKKAEEERRALEEEEERQRVLKLRRKEALEQEMEEEYYRKTSIERQVREATAERLRKEREMKELEELKLQEMAEKKRLDRERRAEETRRLEEWRLGEQRRSEEMSRRQEEEFAKQEKERKARIKIVEAKIRKNSSAELMTGWVTVQNSDALTLMWRRRYFKFTGTKMCLYRSPKDIHQVLDTVELRGKVKAIREWHEGYEELEAIPHSFALEFSDGRGPWSMFSDSEEQKVVLLGLLHQAAGLKL